MTFQYETPFLDLEIYRLVTVLEASPALAEFDGSDETDRSKIEFLRGLEFPEVSRIVVSLAAIIRSAIDADPRAYAGIHPTALEKPVGILLPDTTQDATQLHVWETLNFRDACNKVLHADKVELKRTPDTNALSGELILDGRYRGKDWRAHLDLRKYALTAMSLTP